MLGGHGKIMENDPCTDFEVIKVFNNNVVLACQSGIEKVLYEKGIGFGKRTGDIISSRTPIDKIFSIEDNHNSQNFIKLASNVNSSLIALCEEIIYMISKELGEDLNEKIHVSLIDHISFTIQRLEKGDVFENPFLVETETLYKREFELAKKAVKLLENNLDLSIPDGEIGFIALHIHSARGEGKLSNTLKYTYLSNSIIKLIEDDLNITIDHKTLDYARFLTHIRFTIERIINNNPIRNELLTSIKRKYRRSYKTARKAAEIIENELHLKVPEDEVGYIAIHIERFSSIA